MTFEYNLKLYHKIFGSGQTILILHGLFGMGDNWRSIARRLESDFQCILVDLRNHGRSPHDPEMTFRVMMQDVYELIQDLELENVILLGHSMGGKIAMELALTYPETVDRLIIVDIAPKVYPPHHSQVIRAIRALDPAACSTREDAERVLREYLSGDESTIQFLMKNLSRIPEGGFEWKANMDGIIIAYEHMMEDISFIHPYLGPTLFVRGENSGYVLDSDLPFIHQLFPEAQFVTIPQAGHWVHADNPEGFVRAILPFLQLV